MKFNLQRYASFLSAALLMAATAESHAFALLGPVQPWMQQSNGVIQVGDIGGPMSISNEYRWNVPVVTYAFDQPFMDYFGSNGVAAVEGAFAILNSLPNASALDLDDYPLVSILWNPTADQAMLADLKSYTLALLVQYLGLADPYRYVWTIYSRDTAGPQANYDVIMMNYDPVTLSLTYEVNGVIYFYQIIEENGVVDAVERWALSDLPPYTAVAGGHLGQGCFYTGLTRDDVGGLAYLLSTNNVNYEFLLPGVAGVGANANSFVNGAWRPGVDKITFIPQPTGTLPGTFLPTTNYYTDRYITNGTLQQQELARIITQPDFVFSVDDVTLGGPGVPGFTRTGTTNWSNYAAVNGNTNGAGPGIIQPPFHIVFNKLGPYFSSMGPSDENAYGGPESWASFNQSTDAPLGYPIPHDTNQLTVRMWLEMGTPFNQPAHSFEWKSTSAAGTQFTLQTSTNLMTWRDLFTIPNDGTVCTYFNYNPASPSRFYRLVQQ